MDCVDLGEISPASERRSRQSRTTWNTTAANWNQPTRVNLPPKKNSRYGSSVRFLHLILKNHTLPTKPKKLSMVAQCDPRGNFTRASHVLRCLPEDLRWAPRMFLRCRIADRQHHQRRCSHAVTHEPDVPSKAERSVTMELVLASTCFVTAVGPPLDFA